jgi:two-component system sensor histidine kinase GlrK
MPARPYYPRSFTVLVIIAMAVLTIPLAAGLINAIYVLQGVAETQSRFASNSLVMTRDTRRIVDSVSQLQRAAGQYHLLQDPEFAPSLRAQRDLLFSQLDELQKRLTDIRARAALDRLRADSLSLYARIAPGAFLDSAQFHALDPQFDSLHAQARGLLDLVDDDVQQDTEAIESEVHATQHRLILLAFALIPLSFLLATVFSWLINRPIRQIKASIRQLGQADHRTMPSISGPQDLVELGRELEWLKERLQSLEEQKIYFLRHVSHELKTPLASLREGVGLLGDTLAGPLNARQRDIVDIMDTSGKDLQKRIEDLLRVGSAASMATPNASLPVDLSLLLDKIAGRHRLLLDAHNLTIETEIPDAMLDVSSLHLETALDNLISNAIKFSPDGSKILVSARLGDSTLSLDVCDRGCGIPPEEQGHLFELFFKGSRQHTHAVSGSGLGLAITLESMRSIGGDASLVDRAGWSTCFRLTLPCKPVSA